MTLQPSSPDNGGWALQLTGQDANDTGTHDDFKSVCVIPGAGTTPGGDTWREDQIYTVVERVIDGNTVTTIELFTPVDWGDDPNYCWFVDCGFEGEPNRLVWHPEVVVPGETTPCQYPTLQELTAAEIPDTPADPADTALVAATSVTTAKGLQSIAGAGHYSIDADIDLTGVTWTPIVGFSGVIEGNDYTISNLSIDSAATDNRAIFSTLLTGAEIRNVNFTDCTVVGDQYVAILAARINTQNTVILKNITFTDCSVTGFQYVACLLGQLYTAYSCKIYDCNVVNPTISLTADGYDAGGLIGDAHGNSATNLNYIVRCSTQGGTITLATGATSGGGLIGNMRSTAAALRAGEVYDSYSSAAVTAAGECSAVGGFTGYVAKWDFVSCYSTGAVNQTFASGESGGQSIGGFFGESSCLHDFTNCYSTSDIAIDLTATAGELPTYTGYVGSFAGASDGEDSHFLRCYATGDITVTGQMSGWAGFGGFMGLLRMGSAATANTTNTGMVVERCWSTGDITFSVSTGKYSFSKGGVGGFVGLLWCTSTPDSGLDFDNCYCWGSIDYNDDSTDTAVGGFWGSAYTTKVLSLTIDNVYDAQTNTAAGSGLSNQIQTGDFTNGLWGWDGAITTDPVVANSFWDTDTSDIATDTYAVGHVTSWMQTKSNYEDAGWDFTTIWIIVECTTSPSTTPGYWETIDVNDWPDMTVCVYADAIPRGTFTMDGNDILGFTEADYSVVIAGLNYWSKLETMPIIVAPEPNAVISDKQIMAIRFDFDNTYSLRYGMGSDSTPQSWTFNGINSSVFKLERGTFPYGSRKKATVYVDIWDPVPLGIRAIIPEVTFYRPK